MSEEFSSFGEALRYFMKLERKKYAGRIDQTLIKEFIGSYSKHDSYKIRLARKLGYGGKNVFMEKYLNLAGIRCRADIAYFENGKWNIIEIEYCRGSKNNILKNIKKLSKIANIKVIYI